MVIAPEGVHECGRSLVSKSHRIGRGGRGLQPEYVVREILQTVFEKKLYFKNNKNDLFCFPKDFVF